MADLSTKLGNPQMLFRIIASFSTQFLCKTSSKRQKKMSAKDSGKSETEEFCYCGGPSGHQWAPTSQCVPPSASQSSAESECKQAPEQIHVPGYPEYYNIVYDDDQAVYVYKLLGDYKAGDLKGKMGRTKGSGSSSKSAHSEGPSPAPSDVSTTSTIASAEARIKDNLKELFTLIHQVQEERTRGEQNLTNITKTHERMQQEQKITPYYKTKLRGLYNTAMQDAEGEAELLRKALDKISEIKAIRENRRLDDRPKPIMRRGVLMSMLQQNAVTLPLWVSKPGERPPPLCGAVPADNNYIAKPGDKVAARVKSSDGEENWILAEVVTFNTSTNKYEVDDIDAEEGKERHILSKRKIVPLPIWKASPETDPEALFPRETLILALYPQTTCFYRALVHEPPKKPQDDYSVLFEDTSYPDGYSPPLMVAQRYVILCKEDKKK